MIGRIKTIIVLLICIGISNVYAQVPNCINYQGRVMKSNTNYNGIANLNFSFINADATHEYWNSGSNMIPVNIINGLFSIRIGDTNITNMTLLSPNVFTNSDLRLRVWIDGEQIYPDQIIASVGYAMMSQKLAIEEENKLVHKSGDTMTGPLDIISTNEYIFRVYSGTNVVAWAKKKLLKL